MRFFRHFTLVLAVPFAMACSGGDGGWTGSVTDSAGVAMVANPADGIWGAGQGWTVEEELRIGALEGDPEYQFGQIAQGGITVDSQGRIYVLDQQAQEVKVYSPEGVYEKTIGQRGGGPGELNGAQFLVMGPGDTLVVPDLGNLRVSKFAPDGSELGSFAVALENGIPVVYRATPSGILGEQIRHLDLPNLQTEPDTMDAVRTFALDGTITDTLLTFPAGRTFSFGGGTPEFNIYSAESAWDLADDGGLIYAVNNDYRIRRYGADGSLQTVITKPFEPKPVSQADQDAVMDFLDRAWTQAGVPPQFKEQLKQGVHFGEIFPAFAALIAGPDGTIWVQHVQAASELSEEELETYNLLEDAGAPQWDVFDADGRLLGTVTLPARFTPRMFRGDDIYGVWRDELDVQYVLRLKIVRAT